MKRWITLLLCILLCLPGLTACGQSGDHKSGGFEYKELGNGNAVITGYTGIKANLKIPEKLNGLTVKSIGSNAFQKCKRLRSVTIPNSVTTIGEGAFGNCNNLKTVTIPNSVRSIARDAFYCCRNLRSVTLPDGLTAICEMTFFGCRKLKNITLPNSVTRIDRYAFADCQELQTVTIPDGATTIGERAFGACSSLKEVTIPASVTSMGFRVFETPGENLTVNCASSYVVEYCKESRLNYINNSTYNDEWLNELNKNQDEVKNGKGKKIIFFNEELGVYETTANKLSRLIPNSILAYSVEDIGYVISYYEGVPGPERVEYVSHGSETTYYTVEAYLEEYRVNVIEPTTGKILAHDRLKAGVPDRFDYSGTPPKTYSNDLSDVIEAELLQKLCKQAGVKWPD